MGRRNKNRPQHQPQGDQSDVETEDEETSNPGEAGTLDEEIAEHEVEILSMVKKMAVGQFNDLFELTQTAKKLIELEAQRDSEEGDADEN